MSGGLQPLRLSSRRPDPAEPVRIGASWWRRVIGATAVSVLVLLVGQLVVGAVQVGVTVDEPTHVDRTEQWLDTGWYVPERQLVDGLPNPDNANATPFVYGAAFSSVAHVVNVLVGNESWGEVSTSASSYAVRHLVVVALGLATALAVGLAVWSTTRDRVAGVWGAAGLLAIPVWTGHAMFNVKDVPTAAGYTLLTAGLMLALSRLPCGSPANAARGGGGRPRQLDVAALVAVGTFFGVGTRTAMWVPMALSIVGAAVVVVWSQRELRASVRVLAVPCVGALVGVLAVAALHPANAVTPVRWFVGAVVDSSGFPWSGYTLTAGELLGENPPWWYLPGWVGASIPVLLTVLVLVGSVGIVVGVVRPGGGSTARRGLSDPRRAAPLLAIQQAVLLPGAAMVTGSVLYTGMRQHLYLLPALAIVAGIGVAWLLQRLPGPSGQVATRHHGTAVAVVALVVIALLKPTVEQFQLHPYNYVYVNAVASLDGIDGVWETDYWGASNREALHRVPEGADLRCSNWLIRPWVEDPGPGLGDCDGRHGPFLDEVGRDGGATVDDRVWVVGRVRGGNTVPDGCSEADNVTRPLRTHEVLLAYVLTCDPDVVG